MTDESQLCTKQRDSEILEQRFAVSRAAAPVVVAGVMFTTRGNRVYALDAASEVSLSCRTATSEKCRLTAN